MSDKELSAGKAFETLLGKLAKVPKRELDRKIRDRLRHKRRKKK